MEHDKGSGDSPNTRRNDRSLKMWEKWIDIRNRQTKALAKKTDRPPVDLAMNLAENVREDIERKTALEHAQIVKENPTIRGRPWDPPWRLRQACPCDNVYEAQMTPAQLGRPRIIEHVGVPTKIQETEKGMAGESKRLKCQDADYKEYRDKRENDLKEVIKKIEPYRPDVRKIVCIGHRPKPPPPKIPPLPTIKLSAPCYPKCKTLRNVYALRINDSVFFNDVPGHDLYALHAIQKSCWHRDCCKWTYYFHVPINSTGRGYVCLHNLGTVTLRYCWKRIKKQIPYIPEEDFYDQVFFFNKGEDVLSPNQRKKIHLTFISQKPGLYHEIWHLVICNVNFTALNNGNFVVDLRADAIENVISMNRKVDKMLQNISREAIYLIVRDIINSAVTKATIVEPLLSLYSKLFLESEIFLMKNPEHFYHQTLVETMKTQFTEMCPGETWDLSIPTWRERLMALEYDDRTHYYDILKQAHTDLLKPWEEGLGVKEQKFAAIRQILQMLMDRFDKEYNRLRQLLLGEVEEPTVMSKEINGMLQNMFYVNMYEHIAQTMTLCAGVIDSIDLNRWIEFDFCRHY